MTQVFISYAHRDKQVAQLVARKLRARNVQVWIDEQNLLPGADIAASIHAGIEKSDTIVLILGKSDDGDSWAKREAALALSQKNKRVVPVIASRDADVPYIIRHLIHVDLSNSADAEETAERLALFLSEPKSDMIPVVDGRSDIALVLNKALQNEISVYTANRAKTDLRALARPAATAVVVTIAALGLFGIAQIFDIPPTRFLAFLLGILMGIATSYSIPLLAKYFTRRAQSRAEAANDRL